MVFRTIAALIAGYLLGSAPIGMLIVRVVRKRDVRQWHSGRTGGTNVMRVAGFWAGLATAIGDVGKAALAVALARALTMGSAWAEVASGLLAVIGHNYSIFMIERTEFGIRFRGGAGGAATLGGALGLWPPSVLIILPLAIAVYYGVGFASVTTMSVALLAAAIFAWRALQGLNPWAYVYFGIGAEALILWALRPNIGRLIKGEERLVGWRAKRKKKLAREGKAATPSDEGE